MWTKHAQECEQNNKMTSYPHDYSDAPDNKLSINLAWPNNKC